MSLFHFKKKTEPQSCCCCSDSDFGINEEGTAEECCANCCTPEEAAEGNCCCDCCAPKEQAERSIKVLGGGCKNCHRLMENTQEALKALGMNEPVELVSDMAVIAGYGVMSTPALVVDEKVVSMGRVLTPEQAAEAIQDVRGK